MNRIAVDIDETLLHFLPNMAKYHKMELPPKRFRYVYRNIFDITEARSKRMVIDFYNSQEFHDLEPMKGSQEKLLELKKKCKKLYIVSGRQYYVRQRTEDWIEKHYPGIFDDVVLTNSYTIHEVSKVDIFRSLNIDTMVDDDSMVCLESARSGIKAYNFTNDPVYPWYEEYEYADFSLKSWDDIEIV
jgi:hypothetical protein